MTDDEKQERKRQLDRERGRRYRERHAERVREMARKRMAERWKRNPSAIEATAQRYAAKVLDALAADEYGYLLTRADNFWANVQKGNNCWPWTGPLSPAGYGRFSVLARKVYVASRVALMYRLGRTLAPGMFALHRCDNPACCNPDHLYEGTQKRNIADKFERDRHNPRSGHKLTEDQARQIREAVGTQQQIAEMFGVSRSFVSMVRSGKRWPRIDQEGN